MPTALGRHRSCSSGEGGEHVVESLACPAGLASWQTAQPGPDQCPPVSSNILQPDKTHRLGELFPWGPEAPPRLGTPGEQPGTWTTSFLGTQGEEVAEVPTASALSSTEAHSSPISYSMCRVMTHLTLPATPQTRYYFIPILYVKDTQGNGEGRKWSRNQAQA